MVTAILITLCVNSLHASDAQKKPYSLAGAVVTPNGTMVPRFTVVVRQRSDKPQLVKRFHFTDGLFELRNLRGQYVIQITSPLFTGVMLDLQLDDKGQTSMHRIVVMHPVREEAEKLFPYELKLKRVVPPAAEQAYLRGVELHHQGKLEEAMMAYGDAIRVFPEYVQALSDIGSLYILLNRPESAMTFLRRANRADPGDLTVRLNMASALVNQRHYTEGIRIFEEILQEDEGTNLIRYFLAKAYWSQGRFDAADVTVRQALEVNPQMIEGWVLLLNLADQQGDHTAYQDALHRLKNLLANAGFSQFVDRISTQQLVQQRQ